MLLEPPKDARNRLQNQHNRESEHNDKPHPSHGRQRVQCRSNLARLNLCEIRRPQVAVYFFSSCLTPCIVSFGASEATIFSKHGSFRSGSQNGSSFNWP